MLPGEEPFFYELYERALATKISQADLDRLHLLSVAAAQVIASTEDALHGR